MALWWVAFWIVGMAVYFALPDHNASGQCEGIGFGCTPAPNDTWVLVLAIVGFPVTVAGVLIGSLVLRPLARRTAPVLAGTVVAFGALAAGSVLGLVLVLVG